MDSAAAEMRNSLLRQHDNFGQTTTANLAIIKPGK